MIEAVTWVLATLTLLSDIFLLGFFFLVRTCKGLRSWFSKNALFLAFIVALTATLGSLFFSEIAGYNPCKLCWFQRILIYPQVLLLGLALYYRDIRVARYLILINIINIPLALYHYVIQLQSSLALFCAVGESCTSTYFFYYGYITIPIMSLSASALILLLSFLAFKSK